MIRFSNVTKVYGPNAPALSQVSLHIKSGEFVSIVGESGSGKTTLAKLLFAEERPSSGEVVIGDWDISRIRLAEIPVLRRQIGVVFQDFKLLPRKTVYENVAFALEVSGVAGTRITNLVPQVLSIVGLSDKTGRYPKQLSGGEQQRVSIARSLVHRPKILVADEPTGNLDPKTSWDIMKIFKKLEGKRTIIIATHNTDIVNSFQKRVLVLKEGKIIKDQRKGGYEL